MRDGILRDMTIQSEKEKMLRGQLYRAQDPELEAERAQAQEFLERYNASTVRASGALLEGFLGACGAGAVIRPSFFCDYGYNIFLGRDVFLNFNCVLLDVMPIRIGDGTQIGPAVQIYAADHPRDAAVRAEGLENGRPVWIGKNCWIGGGAILLPGITVEDGAVVGAGTVVTRDVPAGRTVVGNPGRLLPSYGSLD